MSVQLSLSFDTPFLLWIGAAAFSMGPQRHGWAQTADPASRQNHVSPTMATGPTFSSMPQAGSLQVLPQDFVHLGLKEEEFCLLGYRIGRHESELSGSHLPNHAKTLCAVGGNKTTHKANIGKNWSTVGLGREWG